MQTIKKATSVAGVATSTNDNGPDHMNGRGAEKLTHNSLDFPTTEAERKAFETLRTGFALQGLVFQAMSDDDGVWYMAFTWTTVHCFGSLAQAKDFLVALLAEVA